jgi:16S rRNA (cytosine967-C5)-methyltransferase
MDAPSKNVREAIFIALWKGFCKGLYLEEAFAGTKFHDARDQALAYEIYCGTIRLWSQLEWIAKGLTSQGKLNLKNREKALLFSALYQIYFLERVPAYAIIDETVALAKKHCHTSIASFLNGILRNATQKPLTLPHDPSAASLAIRFSQPHFFVERLLQEQGEAKTIAILTASNARPIHFVRTLGLPLRYAPITSGWDQAEGYIQNPTPGMLMEHLSKSTPVPQTILDLCASPGGKLLLAHDFYPKASLYANDVSEARIALLQENISKFKFAVDVRIGTGETYPETKGFDLIILDVPCSNSGVLNKRVEARSRLSVENVRELKELQATLLEHAAKLLNPNGSIWFLTCSILKEENEGVTNIPYLKKITEKTIYPNEEGLDGGYCCHLQK